MTVKQPAEEPQCLLGGTAIKPPERHGWEAIRYAIHDPEKGEFFGRTPKSWFLITLFYCIYYFLLGCFWYGMLNLYFMTIDVNVPKYTLDASIIGTNPGVGMRPLQPPVNVDSSMLYLDAKPRDQRATDAFDSTSNVDWAKRFEKYIARYDNTSSTRECPNDEVQTDGGEACRFDKAMLGDCANYPYGYTLDNGATQVEPCIILKINKIFNWIPEPYDDDDLKYDDSIPETVKELARANRNRLYLNCEGENPADREALEGNVNYYPRDQSISYKYFPYVQVGQNYHNPVVAVKFRNLPTGQLLHIECKLYGKGIRHNRRDRVGSVHFEIFLDEAK